MQRQNSARWQEIEQLAAIDAAAFSEFVRICHTFDRAHHGRLREVESQGRRLADLSPLELLVYASLYAFEHLVPKVFAPVSQGAGDDTDTQEVWDAINSILVWKLQTSTDDAFHFTEATIGNSLRDHLSPFLFPSPGLPGTREDLYQAFTRLVEAQIELNSFLACSVDAFCYDDSIRFELSGTEMVIVGKARTLTLYQVSIDFHIHRQVC